MAKDLIHDTNIEDKIKRITLNIYTRPKKLLDRVKWAHSGNQLARSGHEYWYVSAKTVTNGTVTNFQNF